jgi:hypothetical protein
MRRTILAVLGAVVLAGGAAQAHHGYTAFFDPQEKTVAVEGELAGLLYANPHVVMTIRAADGTVYTVTWQAATWVERNAGVTKETFRAGDHLIVIGAPSRDPQSHEVTMVQEVRRPRDSWRWKTMRPFAQPS